MSLAPGPPPLSNHLAFGTEMVPGMGSGASVVWEARTPAGLDSQGELEVCALASGTVPDRNSPSSACRHSRRSTMDVCHYLGSCNLKREHC